MDEEPYEFEDDLRIKQTIDDGQIFFCAYADEALFRKYPSDRAGNTKVAMQLAVAALSRRKLCKDVLDVAVWFAQSNPDLQCYFAVNRYRYQHPYKVISHIVVASKAVARDEIELIVGEAFEALGWKIDPQGGSSVEWFDARGTAEMSAHRRLKAVERVHKALESFRQAQSE